MPTTTKPAVKPRNRPHSQYNPINREDERNVNEQTQMVNLRNNRRSLDCTRSDYSAAGGEYGTAGGTGNELRTAGKSGRTVNNVNRASGNAPRAAARPIKAADSYRPSRASELESPSGTPGSGNFRGYLTWNSENRTTDRTVETDNQNGDNSRTEPGNIRGHLTALSNSSETNERRTVSENDSNPNAHRSRSRSRSLNNELNRSRTSVNDTSEPTDRLSSRRNTDDSISNYELRRTSSVQAKKQFMVGSYIILFVGILLAVSGAVLTVLAFHNHFGHISM